MNIPQNLTFSLEVSRLRLAMYKLMLPCLSLPSLFLIFSILISLREVGMISRFVSSVRNVIVTEPSGDTRHWLEERSTCHLYCRRVFKWGEREWKGRGREWKGRGRESEREERERWCMEGRETVVAGFMYVCIIGCCEVVLREESWTTGYGNCEFPNKYSSWPSNWRRYYWIKSLTVYISFLSPLFLCSFSSLLASSEEEEDELVFSDELAERGGSDSDSIENMDPVSSSYICELSPRMFIFHLVAIWRIDFCLLAKNKPQGKQTFSVIWVLILACMYWRACTIHCVCGMVNNFKF